MPPSPPLRILAFAGTRPECLKLAALVRAARADARCQIELVGSGQHPAMIAATLTDLDLRTEHDLTPVPPGNSLSRTLGHLRAAMRTCIAERRPDVVVVQGDTSTAYAGALAARDAGVALAHVEAGLRTTHPLRPFPEEPFRRRIAPIARWHFAPTEGARQHLLDEGQAPSRVFVVGNTIVDELRCALANPCVPTVDWQARGSQLLVLTLHRRETYGQALVAVCVAMLELLERHEDLVLVCPVHPNPAVGLRVRRLLGAHPRCLLVSPMGYRAFVRLLGDARLVVTDSGGIQEEAPYLGAPVLIARDATERPEALRDGVVELVGHNHDRLVQGALRLLAKPRPTPIAFDAAAPFGDGHSAPRILDILLAESHAHAR